MEDPYCRRNGLSPADGAERPDLNMQLKSGGHRGIAAPDSKREEFKGFSSLEHPYAAGRAVLPACPVTAVIDIGSGSARAVVMRVNEGGGIEVVAQQRVNLYLMDHLALGTDRIHRSPAGTAGGDPLLREQALLDEDVIERTLDAIEDFVQVCLGYGASAICAVGTEALRLSKNAAEIADAAAHRFGVDFRIISGAEEASYCFAGAVHGLPVSNGLMADLGGGSLETVEFSKRSLETVNSLPLGSLRIANRFNLTDRPSPEDVEAAYRYVREVLAAAHVRQLDGSGALVGSGGSLRLLSRLDRRSAVYPILKTHGYSISAVSLTNLTTWLSGATREERLHIPGMNPQRTHSIVGGAVVAQALLDHAGADRIMVSGQGLREGLARHPQPLPEDQRVTLPSRATVRIDGLAGLVQRFALRYSERGPRRANLARRIADAAWRGRHAQLTSSLQCAALVLDIGSAIDFYNRFNRTAAVISRSDLPGFSHRESAQIAAILLRAERERIPRRFRNTRLLTPGDKRRIGQAAAALLVADELERRLPPGCPADSVSISRESDSVAVVTPAWPRASGAGIEERWEAEFNQPIHIRCNADP